MSEPSEGSDRYPPLFPPGNAKMVMLGLAVGSVFIALNKAIIGNLFGDLAAGIVLLVVTVVSVGVAIHLHKKQKAAGAATPRT